MFIGHFAVALAGKRAAPEASLGVLVAAGQLIDLLFPIFLLLGLESAEIDPGNTRVVGVAFNNYPYTHSLLAVLVWAALAAGLYYAWRRRRRAALVIGALVLSHWVLDLITHRPDLPLYPGESPKFGLGLWNSLAGTVLVEGAMFITGLWLYLRGTRPRDAIGRWALAGFVAFVLVIYVLNITSPPPPDPKVMGRVAIAAWLFPLWAWWLDRHRELRAGKPAR